MTLHDVMVAGIAAAGLVVRGGWASRTRWSGDEIAVDALRTLVPWAALAAGVSAAGAGLPLTAAVSHNLHLVLVAMLILAATLTAARTAAGLIRALALSRSGVAGSATIFVNITRIAVVAIGILVLLQTLGITVAAAHRVGRGRAGGGAGAAGHAGQPVRGCAYPGVEVQPGDYIRLGSGEEGYVVDINWRYTVVRQLPYDLLIVPNAQLAGAIMTNYHQPGQQMSVLVQAGVGYGSDLDHVDRVTTAVAAEVMAQVPGGVPSHEPTVRFHTFGESSIDFSVILRAREFSDQYLVKHELIKRLHRRYRAEGIEIPFPMRTVIVQHQDQIPVRRHGKADFGPAQMPVAAAGTPTSG
ncbi:small-conductance mechanosensitive channel [Streptomyces sp. SPB162]|nr:mechanosensitive ion channel family protein [Streptomyces sp. SPB162]MDF9816647.1 small-conductance mechanosensitive channel [Streptomyces sp. SPB162]